MSVEFVHPCMRHIPFSRKCHESARALRIPMSAEEGTKAFSDVASKTLKPVDEKDGC